MKHVLDSYDSFTKLLAFPTAFHVPFDSGDHVFTIIFHLIKEARRMIANLKMVYNIYVYNNG